MIMFKSALPERKRPKLKQSKRNAIEYALFLVVPLSLYVVFFIVPNITTYVYSLFKYDGFSNFEFIGIQNFVRLMSDRKFGMAFKNTLVYTGATVIGQNALALVFAVLIVKQTRINNIFKTVFYLPAIMSSIAIGFIWGFILDPNLGVINNLFKDIGLPSFAQNWLGNRNIVMFSISAIHIWQAVGGATIIFISGLLNIPNELNECANIDGANKLQVFFRITFPMLRPVTIINVVLTTIGCFKSFDYVYVMTAGGGDGSSHVLATWLFRNGFQFREMGYASAMAVVLSLTAAILAFAQFRLNRDEID